MKAERIVMLMMVAVLVYSYVADAEETNNVIITSNDGKILRLGVEGSAEKIVMGPDMKFHFIDAENNNTSYRITIDNVIIAQGNYSHYGVVYYNATQKTITLMVVQNGNQTYNIRSIVITAVSDNDAKRFIAPQVDYSNWLSPADWTAKQWRIVIIIIVNSGIGMWFVAPAAVKIIRMKRGWIKLG